MSNPRRLRALDRTQYEFDFDAAPLREHRLYAYARSDDDLLRASNAKLRKDFEEHVSFPWFDPIRRVWRIKRLKGFDNINHYFKRATLIFTQRGPEIPYFGLRASELCPDTPIMYSSCTQKGEETLARFFHNGEEYFGDASPDLEAKFKALDGKQWGILTCELQPLAEIR